MTDPAQELKRSAPALFPESRLGATGELGRRDSLMTGLFLLGIAAGLFLVWQISASLLVIFAGILLASFFDACARALERIVPIHRAWRLALVVLILSALLALGLIWGTGRIPEQTRFLARVMDAQLDVLQQRLLAFGVELFGPEGGRDFSQWLPDHSKLFGHAQTALGTASHILANTVVILFLGLLFSFDPQLYRDSIVLLVKPSYRPRVRDVLDEMGRVLRLWFMGQIIRVILMAACVWLVLYAIGMPGALMLGLQAGMSNFIPYLGPIAAAIPVALVAMPYGPSMLIWAIGTYAVVQSIEGYVIGPLIQRQTVSLPPAWTLVAILIFGAMFGVMGIALAMPLVAVARVAVIRFYVEDILGDTLSSRKL